MELLTLTGNSLVSVPDPIAPLVNPEGPRPTGTALSPLMAAVGSEGAASDASKNALGLLSDGQGMKNILFLGLVGFLIWKYGRKVLSA